MRVQPPRLTCLSNGTQSPSDVAIRRYQPRHRVVHHGHRFAASPVRRLECAAAQEPRAGRLEIPGTRQGQDSRRLLHRRFTRLAPKTPLGSRRGTARSARSAARSTPGRFDSRDERALVECLARLWRVVGAPEIDPRDERVIDVDAAVNRIHVPQRPHEQAGADEQRQRQGHLQHDERAAGVVASQRADGARVLERLYRIDLHRADRGKDAEEQAGHQRDAQREQRAVARRCVQPTAAAGTAASVPSPSTPR